MAILRPLVLTLLKGNICLNAYHVPGKDNKTCDFLSRQPATPTSLIRFGLSPRPLPVPSTLRPHNFALKPTV